MCSQREDGRVKTIGEKILKSSAGVASGDETAEVLISGQFFHFAETWFSNPQMERIISP